MEATRPVNLGRIPTLVIARTTLAGTVCIALVALHTCKNVQTLTNPLDCIHTI